MPEVSTITASDWSIVKQIRHLLTGAYPPETILRELLQNANDALAGDCLGESNPRAVVIDSFSGTGNTYSLAEAPAIFSINSGPVTNSDLEAICRLADSNKQPGQGRIGQFGLGMKSLFHIAECFVLVWKNAGNENLCSRIVHPWGNIRAGIIPFIDDCSDDLIPALSQRILDAYPSISRWEQWLCVWVPLRTKQFLESVGHSPVIQTKTFDSPTSILTETAIEESDELLPLLPNLHQISIGNTPYNSDGFNKVEIEVPISEEQSNEFNTFKNDQQWPRVSVTDADTGEETESPDRRLPFARFVLVHRNGGQGLRVRQSVGLPLTEGAFDHGIGDNPEWVLYCDAPCFVDAGRKNMLTKPSDDPRVKWNTGLLKVLCRSILPSLITQANNPNFLSLLRATKRLTTRHQNVLEDISSNAAETVLSVLAEIVENSPDEETSSAIESLATAMVRSLEQNVESRIRNLPFWRVQKKTSCNVTTVLFSYGGLEDIFNNRRFFKKTNGDLPDVFARAVQAELYFTEDGCIYPIEPVEEFTTRRSLDVLKSNPTLADDREARLQLMQWILDPQRGNLRLEDGENDDRNALRRLVRGETLPRNMVNTVFTLGSVPIPAIFQGDITIISRDDTNQRFWSDIVKLFGSWEYSTTLEFCARNQYHPSTPEEAGVIVNAILHTSATASRQEFVISYLNDNAWVPITNGPLASPSKLLAGIPEHWMTTFPEIRENGFFRGEECLIDGLFAKIAAYGLGLSPAESIQKILGILSSLPQCRLGAFPEEKKDDNETIDICPVLESFSLCRVESPIVEILREARNLLDEATFRNEAKAFRHPLPSDACVARINYLTNGIATHSLPEQFAWLLLRNYVHERLDKVHCIDIPCLNERKEIQPPSQLVAQGDGIDATYLLNSRYGEKVITDLRNRVPPISHHQNAGFLHLPVFQCFDQWPDEDRGLTAFFVLCCSRNPATLAGHPWASAHAIQVWLENQTPLISVIGTNFDEVRDAVAPHLSRGNFELRCFVRNDGDVIPAVAINGNSITVPMTDPNQIRTLLLGQHPLVPCGNVLEVYLRGISRETCSALGQTTRREILKRTLKHVLTQRGFGNTTFEPYWSLLSRSEQISIALTKSVVLGCLPRYLEQLRCTHPSIENAIAAYRDWELDVARKTDGLLGNMTHSQLDERKRQILGTLAHSIETDPDVAQEILNKLRSAMRRSYGYSETSLLFELFQNADDALCELEQLPGCHPLNTRFVVTRCANDGFLTLTIQHYGRAINQSHVGQNHGVKSYEYDLQRMLLLNTSGKQQDSSTGKFGLGFKTVFFVSDEPHLDSGTIHCSIRAGVLPVADEHADNDAHTIITLPVRPEAFEDANHAINAFQAMAPFISVFAKRADKIEINGNSYAFTQDLAEADLPIHITLSNRITGLLFPCGPGRILFGFDATTWTLNELPANVPTIWNVTPTAIQKNLGFAVSAPFDLDTGRQNLQANSATNEQVAHGMANDLFAFLDRLTTAIPETNRYAFFASFFKLFHKAAWGNDTSESAIHLLRILFGIDARDGSAPLLRVFLENHDVVPTCLDGDFRRLVRLSRITNLLSRPLVDGGFLALAQDLGFLLPGTVASDALAPILERMGSIVPPVYGVTDFLAELRTLWHGQVPVDKDVAPLLSAIQTALKTDSEKERGAIREQLAQFRFQNCAGGWNTPLPELLVYNFNHEIHETHENISEERMRAAFAPNAHLLSDTYSGDAVRLFRLCREKTDVANVLDTWARNATGDRQRAALLYIANGHDNATMIDTLRNPAFRHGTWLERESLTLNPALQFDYLLRLRVYAALHIVEPPPPPFEPQHRELSFDDVQRWWNDNSDTTISDYNRRVYETNNTPDLTDQSGKSTWMELLVLGACHTLGRARLEAHHGFIQMLKNRSFWDVFTAPTIQPDLWIDVLDDFSAREEFNPQFGYWMRLFPRIYQFSRYWEQYKEVFGWWNDESFVPAHTDDLVRFQTNRALQGTGITAPGLQPALGKVGSHFVFRELVRRGFVTNSAIHPFCFVPYRAIAEEADVARESQSIWTQVKDAIGEENATFGGAFDIAITAYLRDHSR